MVNIDVESMEKIIDSLKRIGASYLIFGGAIILLSIFSNHDIGLKLGIVTLTFGAVFRLYNGLTKTYMDQVKEIEQKWQFFHLVTLARFAIWFGLVIYYFYLVNGFVNIIN